MDAIDKIAGASQETLQDYDWPNKGELKDFTWPEGLALRGSIRLAAGLITDREEVEREWVRVKTSLLKQL